MLPQDLSNRCTSVRTSSTMTVCPVRRVNGPVSTLVQLCFFTNHPWCQKNAKIHVREIIQEVHEIADLQQQKILILMWNLLVYNIQKKTNFSITNYIATLLVIINQQRRSEYRLFVTSSVPVIFYYVIII